MRSDDSGEKIRRKEGGVIISYLKKSDFYSLCI